MTDFDIQIAHSVQEIGQRDWDRLSKDRPFASYQWYRFGETVLENETPIYVVLSRKGEAVARATFWLRSQEWMPVSSKIVSRLVQTMLHHWPLLVCQSPLISTSGLILPEPPLRDAALRTIAHFAQDLAQRYRASFLILSYLERHQTKWAAWPDVFMPVAGMDPGTRLVITWPDFDSYLGSLSKKARRQYRLNCHRAADLGIEIKRHHMATPLSAATLDQAMSLIRNVEVHHNSAPDPWARAVLEHASMIDTTWLQTDIEGQMVGCCILLGDGDTRVMKLMGLDYDVRYAYFQLFYMMIQCAIEQGARVLRGGTHAYETKQRMGFQLESNHHPVFTSRSRVLRWVGQRFSAA